MKLTTKRKVFGKRKVRIWEVYLGDQQIAIATRDSINWVGTVVRWGYIKGLEGKGIYRECRKAMEKLAKIIEHAHLGKQDEFEVEF